MALDMLIQEAQGMSDASLMEVVRFMRFIKIGRTEEKASEKGGKVRVAGKYKNQGWMAENFDDTPEDFREYM